MRNTSRTKGSTITNWILTIILLAMALIPTWLFLLIKNLLNPEGFWQQFVVYGFGLWLFGGLQFVLILAALGILVQVIWE